MQGRDNIYGINLSPTVFKRTVDLAYLVAVMMGLAVAVILTVDIAITSDATGVLLVANGRKLTPRIKHLHLLLFCQ